MEDGGHAVSPGEFADLHINARRNFERLLSEFGNDIIPRVYDNTGKNPVEITIEDLHGKTRYSKAKIDEITGRSDSGASATRASRSSGESGGKGPQVETPTIGDTIAELDRLIAEEEAGTAPSGKAEGLPSRSQSFAPGPGVKGFFSRLVSKNSIVRAIKDNFPEFAIRGKNTTNIGKNYNGHFEPWRELIRSKDMSSIDTIPHEIGHGISILAT